MRCMPAMVQRAARSRPSIAPAGFIRPCRPTAGQRVPQGPGWVHELKHDGNRLQVHIRDGQERLYTMNGHKTDRYRRIVEEAAQIRGDAIIDAGRSA